MNENGHGPNPLSLPQRVDPARVRQLEQQAALQATLLMQRAFADVRELTNSVHHVTEAARKGDPQAVQALKMLWVNLDDAKAAGAGIAVVRDTPREVT
jgi:hypothetical protein